eukprot:49225-Eustigmatos_ZCMA.PRE.1
MWSGRCDTRDFEVVGVLVVCSMVWYLPVRTRRMHGGGYKVNGVMRVRGLRREQFCGKARGLTRLRVGSICGR